MICDAWGNIVHTYGQSVDTIGEVNPFRYRGYYYDVETGLYYVGSRYYNPKVGRWINADAITDGGTAICFAWRLYATISYGKYIYFSFVS